MNRRRDDHPKILNALSRAGARWPLTRIGLAGEPTTALPSDTPEVVQLLADDGFAARLAELATSLGRDPGEVTAEAAGHLREMGAMHSARAMSAWSRFTTWMF